MSARDAILARVRAACGGGAADAAARVRARIADPPGPTIPARARGPHSELLSRFVAMAEQVAATVAQVAGPDRVPAEVAGYMAREGLGVEAVIARPGARHGLAAGIPWHDAPRLILRQGPARDTDRVSVSPAVAGIAETGTVLVRCGAGLPNTLYFLPETHIVVLSASTIVGAYEDGWALLGREVSPAHWPPRAATMITGPSRTSDIEKTLQVGVHGPRRLHIIVVHGEKT